MELDNYKTVLDPKVVTSWTFNTSLGSDKFCSHSGNIKYVQKSEIETFLERPQWPQNLFDPNLYGF